MRFGILTGGGDCPGLNAVIRAVVRSALMHGDEVVGFRDGWGGVLDGDCLELPIEKVAGILPRGGTILGTSRRSALQHRDLVARRFAEQRLDGLIAVGGNGTLFAAHELSGQFPIVGVPKTIDNDISGTDRTLRLRQPRSTSPRPRSIASTPPAGEPLPHPGGRGDGPPRRLDRPARPGLAGGADVILVPERPFDHRRGRRAGPRTPLARPRVLNRGGRRRRHGPGRGTRSTRGGRIRSAGRLLGGIGHWLEAELEERTKAETRVVVLGHMQRGGTATAYDRVLASRMGQRAHLAAYAGDLRLHGGAQGAVHRARPTWPRRRCRTSSRTQSSIWPRRSSADHRLHLVQVPFVPNGPVAVWTGG